MHMPSITKLDNITLTELVNTINQLRKDNKNTWYTAHYVVNEHHIVIKGYNTWLQRFNINGCNDSNTSDTSVKQFKAYVTECLKDIF